MYVTHGDIFDWIEKLPDDLQGWVVHHFSLKEAKPPKKLKKMVKFKKKNNHRLDPTQVFKIGPLEEVKTDSGLDGIPHSTSHRFLEKCFEHVDKMNTEKGLNLTSAVVAHTHEPAISGLG